MDFAALQNGKAFAHNCHVTFIEVPERGQGSFPLDPPPNDVIFDDFGLKITLNQQTHDVEGGFGEGFVVNAIAVDLDLLGVKGLIDIAQSKASISEAAVPEPSTWAMMGLGFAGLALAYRRGRKATMIG